MAFSPNVSNRTKSEMCALLGMTNAGLAGNIWGCWPSLGGTKSNFHLY